MDWSLRFYGYPHPPLCLQLSTIPVVSAQLPGEEEDVER